MYIPSLTASGVPVTYNWNKEVAYGTLVNAKSTEVYQAPTTLCEKITQYLQYLVENMERTVFNDAMIAKEFMTHWTTHNITFHILSNEEYDAFGVKTYQHVRFLSNGDVDICTSIAKYGLNVSCVYECNLVKAIPTSTGALPATVQQALSAAQGDIDAVLVKLRSLSGLADVTFQFDALAAHQVLGSSFTITSIAEYLSFLQQQLAAHWKDDMLRDAILEEWKAPHIIRLLPNVDWSTLGEDASRTVHNEYVGVRLAHGIMDILVATEKWRFNISQLYQQDITKVL